VSEPVFPALVASSGASMSLRRVCARGRARGRLLSMSVRQHYRNDTPDTLETVYTFPIPWRAVLTGLSVEIAGRRLDGAVLPRADAQARYEEAVGDGDSPILVEQVCDGLCTANLGNLKPGETATIELSWAQLLQVEHGRVRLSVPTTIAPRFGDAVRDGGLGVHDAVDASLSAAYPFELALRIDGALGAGRIASPTHAIEVARDADGAQLRLAPGAWLDRDLVLTFETDGARAHATSVADDEGRVVLASFCPALGVAPRSAIDVKLLVDCSGSMAGDAIDSARRGLHRALAELRIGDRFSFSRFGSRTVHAFDGLQAAEDASIAEASRAVGATEADLGGTELHAALSDTFALGGDGPADVLLVTDGEVWAIEPVVEAARASGHRVFAVGVGSAPAESLLRRLAEATGGACELVVPNERVEDAIARMFARLRVARARDVVVDWGAPAAWSTRPPRSVFDGDTLHVVAGFDAGVGPVAPVLRYRLEGDERTWAIEAPVEHVDAPAGEIDAPDAAAGACTAGASRTDADPAGAMAALLPRIAAHQRIVDAAERLGERGAMQAWMRDLAVRHRLVTSATSLFLVHRRADDDKATDLPTLQKVRHMVAAGWGGTGSVSQARARVDAHLASAAPSIVQARPFAQLESPAVWRSARAAAPIVRDAAPPDAGEGASSARRPIRALMSRLSTGRRTTPRRLLSTVRSGLRSPEGLDALLRRLEQASLPDELAGALREIEAGGASREEAWLLVLDWLARHFGDAALPGEAATRAIGARLAAVPRSRREAGAAIAARRLGAVALAAG